MNVTVSAANEQRRIIWQGAEDLTFTVKVLMEILEKRIEASKSTIVCSQREPGSWEAMIMNDEVSANAIMKRATKHYIVVIQPIEKP